MSTFFNELLESVKQMDGVVKSERTPSCQHRIDAIQAKEISQGTGLGVDTEIAINPSKKVAFKKQP